jgi:replication factor C subunit 3/5
MNPHIPWVEKYRPTSFSAIILDSKNRQILENIIKSDIFPNILAHGFPGTGKTTTIINLIQKYYETRGTSSSGMVIHLNASDERGIDIIRNQLNNFVCSKSLFSQTGLKFVILDEVDYMTKNAQQALRYLIQMNNSCNVRFCLICNYISRIDDGLQQEFLKIRFNNLPNQEVYSFLNHIVVAEKLNFNEVEIQNIIFFYQNDVRSMINFMQCNYNKQDTNYIIHDGIFDSLMTPESTIDDFYKQLDEISKQSNTNEKQIILLYCHYLSKTKHIFYTKPFLNFLENLFHNDCETKYFVKYAFKMLHTFLFTKQY